MKIYHGTSERAARGIVRRGIIPTSLFQEHGTSDFKDVVYLTSGYAGLFASRKCKLHERWAIIEVDTSLIPEDERWLCPDENFLEQGTSGTDADDFFGVTPQMSQKQRMKCYRNKVDDFSHLWKDSLDSIGAISHVGVIPPEAITRVVSFNPLDHPMLCDMVTELEFTITEWTVHQKKLEALTKWMCGYKVRASDLNEEFCGESYFLGEKPSDRLLLKWHIHNERLHDVIQDRTGFRVIKGEPIK